MGKRIGHFDRWHFSASKGLHQLLLCCFFVLGAAVGHILAQVIGSDSTLSEVLLRLGSQNIETSASSLWQVLLVYFRFPLLAFLLGYCSFALAAIPILMAAQGFSLAFAASALTVSIGTIGIPLALASFGLRSLITIVCTLFFALHSFDRALVHDGKSKQPARVALILFFLLILGTVLELTVMPTLFSSALASLEIY